MYDIAQNNDTSLTFILYHNPCFDGMGAAVAAKLAGPPRAVFVPINYDNVKDFDTFTVHIAKALEQYPQHVEALNKAETGVFGKNSALYLLDFSVPPAVFEELRYHLGWIVMLDHHESAFKKYNPSGGMTFYEQDILAEADKRGVKCQGFIRLDNTKSGAVLAWEYFHRNTPIPSFFQMIQDRDLWTWKLPDTKAFTAYLGLLNQKGPQAVEEWSDFYYFCEDSGGYEEVTSTGNLLLKKHDQEVAKLVTKAHDLYIPPRSDEQCSYLIQAVNCPAQYSSDVGHILASKEGASFGATYHIESRGVARVSLRGNGSVNVAEIAERFGGGGHANAAGFTISAYLLVDYLR